MRIIAAEPSQPRIDPPDHAVGIDIEPAHRGAGIRQGDFLDIHRFGVNAQQAIGAIAGDPDNAVFRDLDAIGPRVGPRTVDQPDLATLRIETADHIAALQREPHDAIGIELGRVRVAGGLVGHRILCDLAAGRIEAANRGVAIASIPGIAVRTDRHRMRPRAGGQIKFLHRAGLRVEPAENVQPLPDPPDTPIARLDRIARALPQGRHLPFLEADDERAIDRCRGAVVIGRVMFGKIVEDFRLHFRRAGQVDHRRGERLPVITRIARCALDRAD